MGDSATAGPVLISYAHDDVAHEDAVRNLWSLLRANGIDAVVDLPAGERRQDWPLWMIRQIRDAVRILVVASPEYQRRAEGYAPPDQGRGVAWEAGLIRERMYANREAGLELVLPVVLPGRKTEELPLWLMPTGGTAYQVSEFSVDGAERLIRVLTGHPWEVDVDSGTVHAPDSADAAAPARVFISHAHDDDDHERRVRELWLLLRRSGIDARIDLPAADRPQDWARWMLAEVRAAAFVLVIASPAYRRRAEGEEPADVGRGVRWEAQLIRQEVYADPEAARGRFLPVVLPGGSPADIPVWMGRETNTHYSVTEFTVGGGEALLRYLTGQPRVVVPPIGPIPRLLSRDSASSDRSTDSRKGERLDAARKRYDVFLSYTRSDVAWVRALAQHLRDQYGFRVWFDEWCLVGGENWIPSVERGMDSSDVIAICLGGSSEGKWARQELERALAMQARNRDLRVIPLLLPASSAQVVEDLETSFLGLRTWVDFRRDADLDYAYHILAQAIRGRPVGPWCSEVKVLDRERKVQEGFRRLQYLKLQGLRPELELEYQRRLVDIYLDDLMREGG